MQGVNRPMVFVSGSDQRWHARNNNRCKPSHGVSLRSRVSDNMHEIVLVEAYRGPPVTGTDTAGVHR